MTDATGHTTDETASGPAAIHDVLRDRIVSGALAPGTHLVEGALAKEFGTSRSPVREALSRLGHEGLIERHERAMRVRVLRAEDILELYEVRIALERAAARAAADRRTDLDLGRLASTVESMQALAQQDTDSRPKLAHAFHFALWRASHNATLVEMLESLHLRVMGLSSTTLHYPERWSVFIDECQRLVAAIRDRDVSLAGDVADEQMRNARDFRVKLYSANPDQVPARHPAGR